MSADETVQALEESEAYCQIMQNLLFVVNHIKDTHNDGFTLVNCDPREIKVKVQEVLDNLNKISNVKIFDSVEAMVEDLHQPSDTELLDFLQEETDKASYSGVSDVRQAIMNYMKRKVKE